MNKQHEIHPFRQLAQETLKRYGSIWGFTRRFVSGKLLHDPIYAYLMRDTAWMPEEGVVLDIGCGRGILLSLLATARQTGNLNRPGMRLRGVEIRATDAGVARKALGDVAGIEQGNVLQLALPVCSAVILLDVLLYIDAENQLTLLDRIAESLEPGGLLMIREADAGQGWRFRVTAMAERLCAWTRFEFKQRYHYRSRAEWMAELELRGFSIRLEPMSNGTPFANVLMLARKAVITNPH